MAGRTLYEFGSGDKEELRFKARERRKWVNRFGTRDRRKVISWVFLPSVSSLLFASLLFSILHHFFGSRPGRNGVGTGCTTSGYQSLRGGVSLCAGSAETSRRAVLIGCGTYGFVRLRT